MGEVVAAAVQAIFEVMFYVTGRNVLLVLSGGRWRASPLGSAPLSGWVERQPDGTLLVSQTTTSAAGMAFWGVILIVLVIIATVGR